MILVNGSMFANTEVCECNGDGCVVCSDVFAADEVLVADRLVCDTCHGDGCTLCLYISDRFAPERCPDCRGNRSVNGRTCGYCRGTGVLTFTRA